MNVIRILNDIQEEKTIPMDDKKRNYSFIQSDY